MIPNLFSRHPNQGTNANYDLLLSIIAYNRDQHAFILVWLCVTPQRVAIYPTLEATDLERYKLCGPCTFKTGL